MLQPHNVHFNCAFQNIETIIFFSESMKQKLNRYKLNVWPSTSYNSSDFLENIIF